MGLARELWRRNYRDRLVDWISAGLDRGAARFGKRYLRIAITQRGDRRCGPASDLDENLRLSLAAAIATPSGHHSGNANGQHGSEEHQIAPDLGVLPVHLVAEAGQDSQLEHGDPYWTS
jgi:hypothetical protein